MPEPLIDVPLTLFVRRTFEPTGFVKFCATTHTSRLCTAFVGFVTVRPVVTRAKENPGEFEVDVKPVMSIGPTTLQVAGPAS